MNVGRVGVCMMIELRNVKQVARMSVVWPGSAWNRCLPVTVDTNIALFDHDC